MNMMCYNMNKLWRGGEKMIGKYLLNINKGIIHNGCSLCDPARRMAEKNKKWFDKYEDAVNFYTGKTKANPCGICLKEKE